MANNIILPFSELQAELNDEAMIDPDAIIKITENGRYNVAKYGYADVNVEGGGGSSDFSTAKVTLTIGSVETVGIQGACILEEDGVEYLDSSFPVAENITSVISAVLYKGEGIAKIQTDGTVTVTGNIQQITPNVYNITGDCTITIITK